MRIKKLALGLLLVLPSIIGLMSCSKKKEGYTVKVSVTDIGTAKVYLDAVKTADAIDNIRDSLVSKLNANANGAKITSVKVTYINEKGKKIEDKIGGLDVNGKFEKTYRVRTGKTIIVTATAEGSPVANIIKAQDELQQATEKWAVGAWIGLWDWASDDDVTTLREAVDSIVRNPAWNKDYLDKIAAAWKASGIPGKPAEVTLPSLKITIEKGGETIVSQSVTASKNGLQPQDLAAAGKKTKVSATATAVASK